MRLMASVVLSVENHSGRMNEDAESDDSHYYSTHITVYWSCVISGIQ